MGKSPVYVVNIISHECTNEGRFVHLWLIFFDADSRIGSLWQKNTVYTAKHTIIRG